MKETACACAGIYTAPQALELYAEAFAAVGRLDKLEAFAARNGPAFYGLPLNPRHVILEQVPRQKLHKHVETRDSQKINVFGLPKGLAWRASML